MRHFVIGGDVAVGCQLQDLPHRFRQNAQLPPGFLGEEQRFDLQLLPRFDKVDGVIAQPFKIADGVLHLAHAAAVLLGQRLSRQIDQIGIQPILVEIQRILLLQHHFGVCFIIGSHQGHRFFQRLPGGGRHAEGIMVTFLQRDGGRTQQQQVGRVLHRILGGSLLLGPDQPLAQFDQLIGEGHQERCDGEIVNGVHHGDIPRRHRMMDKFQLKYGSGQQIKRQADEGADDLDGKVDHGDPLGLVAGTDTGDQRSCAGTDIQAHHHRDDHFIGQAAGQGQRLQNAHGGCRALNDGGEHRSDHNAQQRIAQSCQNSGKLRHFCQGADGIAHDDHSVHQDGKADQHSTDALFLIVIANHHHDNADDGENGRKVFGLEHLQPDIAALDAGKGKDPSGEGGADIGAENDIKRLAKLHDTGIDQAHQHYGDRRRGLHRNGNGRAQQHTDPRAGGHRFQQLFQPAARHLFQVAGHNIHAKQKKCQSQYQAQKRENIHRLSPLNGSSPRTALSNPFPNRNSFILPHLVRDCPVISPKNDIN